MPIKRRRTLKAVRDMLEARERGPFTFYLNKGTYKRFKRKCGKRQMSKVVEQMMEEFIRS